jgi:hypothetical protein
LFVCLFVCFVWVPSLCQDLCQGLLMSVLSFFQWFHEVGIFLPALEIRNMRVRDVKWLVERHTVGKREKQKPFLNSSHTLATDFSLKSSLDTLRSDRFHFTPQWFLKLRETSV